MPSQPPGQRETVYNEFFRFVWQPIPAREYIPEPPQQVGRPLAAFRFLIKTIAPSGVVAPLDA